MRPGDAGDHDPLDWTTPPDEPDNEPEGQEDPCDDFSERQDDALSVDTPPRTERAGASCTTDTATQSPTCPST